MICDNVREIIGGLVGEDADVTALNAALDEIDGVSEGANARIAELESALAEARDKYTQTAARNYELIQAATGEQDAGDDSGEDAEPESDADIINSLFD